MDTLAPPVVAVVVAHDPGPWFAETLTSLAHQDYPELAVLVLDAAGTREDLAERVAAVLPSAYVRRLEDNRGFGASVNEARTMIDGADYFLLCHDDVALDPDAVHLLVEEAFRSNAGIVSPKVVSWDDPERLVHVGLGADKGGAVVDRVHPHEIDHGQHDAVRDVFLAPGGCMLIRVDLFAELGGFNPAIVAMGEDLELCWRAQVVGARVIVAPAARVRHREELAAGRRELTPLLGGAPGPRHPVTLQELQRRHELLAVGTCYGRAHLWRVLPQVFLLAAAEVVVAELAGNRLRARAVVRAWRWNLARLGALRARRADLGARRRLPDRDLRRQQVRGSARLSAYLRRVFQLGFRGAHADDLADEQDRWPEAAGEPAGGAAAAGPTDSGPTDSGRVGARVRLAVWLAAALLLVIGSRGVLTGRLPAVGQFAPFPSWTSTVSQFFAGWHPSGVGTTAPAAPALALAGVVGTVLLGAMGLTQTVLVFGCLPLGAWGVVHLLRPFGSQRAALVAGLAYLAMPLAYDAVALGRWGALVAYAGAPWVLAALARAARLHPYGPTPGGRPGGRTGAWTTRHGQVGAAFVLGLLVAVLVAFAPGAAVVVVLAALALLPPAVLFHDGAGAGRAVGVALGATGVAAVISLPWVLGVLSAGTGALGVFGPPTPASGAAGWGELLRFSLGPIGDSPLAWGFVVAALAPLVLARDIRFRWAVRFWSIALVSWLAAWAVGRGWTGSLAVDPQVLLAPAAAATAAAIGLGIAAFEVDLRRAEFGWRQLTTVVGALAVAVATLPTLASALPGRWDLPVNDFAQSVAWMHGRTVDGAFRVLWLGDPRALNQGSWAQGDGLAYATSEDGPPDARWLWNGTAPGPAASLGTDVGLARSGRTDRLGSLLAPAGVRYVVVLTSLAPEIVGEQSPPTFPVPSDLLPALGRQLDLVPVVSGTGMTVYANAAWIPVHAEVAAAVGPAAAAPPLTIPPDTPLVAGARPVLPAPPASRSARGNLTAGTVLAAVAPAGRWELTGASGATLSRSSSFGWAARYSVPAATTGTLRFAGGPWPVLAGLYAVVAWLLALAALVDRRRIRREWARVARARHRSASRGRAREDIDDVWTEDEAGG